jgi:hypothetical protein
MWIFFAILWGSLNAQGQDFGAGISDSNLDTMTQLEYFFLSEVIPVGESKVFQSEGNAQLIQKVRPYVVELLSSENLATGIVLGFNKLNQAIILTAGHVLMYKDFELANVRHIFLDQPHGNQAGSIVDEKSHVVLPAWRGENSLTSKGWYGLSIFHPPYHVHDSLILREQKMDFGLYMMTGRTVDFSPTQPNLEASYNVREAINTPVERPQLGPLRTAKLQKLPLSRNTPVGTRVLVMGVSKPTPTSVPEMSVVFSKVQSDSVTEKISEKYALGMDTNIQYLLLGEFEKSMNGGGVFNELGELVGIVTKVLKNRAGRPYGAIVLDIEHILQNIESITSQLEVLKVVTEVKDAGRGFGRQCSLLFSK